ncbi:hypothetical protein AB0L10_42220 [Streptomyces flaveolus]|uniref:hypothetical protein n=1 Tax=Streptomyces flaveolus TaxID=67297 RepID=UPI00344968E9
MAALIPSVLFGGLAAYFAYDGNQTAKRGTSADVKGEQREEAKDREEKKANAGPSVKITRGEAPFVPNAFAAPTRTYDVTPIAATSNWDETFDNWLRSKKARPVGVYSARFTVKALRDESAIIQDLRVADRKCQNTVYEDSGTNMHGTLIYPPALGGSGEVDSRIVLGVDVGQYDGQQARFMLKGSPKFGGQHGGTTTFNLGRRFTTRTVTLEKNDARSFDIYFASQHDCSFRLEMNVTSGDRDEWINVPITPAWQQGQTHVSLAGFAEPYDTLVRPIADGSGMELGNALREGGTSSVKLTINDYTD